MTDKHKVKMTGVRLTDEERQAIEEIALELHKEGVGGMINLDNTPVLTNVIRYLILKERERVKSKKNSLKDKEEK